MDAERLFCHGKVINNRYNRKKGYCNQEGGYYEKVLAAEILATETAAIRTNFAAESVSQILAK